MGRWHGGHDGTTHVIVNGCFQRGSRFVQRPQLGENRMSDMGRLADVPTPLHRGEINHRGVDAASQNGDGNCGERNPQARRPANTADRANQHCHEDRYRPNGCITPNAPNEKGNSVTLSGSVRPLCNSLVICPDHKQYVARTRNVCNWAIANTLLGVQRIGQNGKGSGHCFGMVHAYDRKLGKRINA